MDKRFLIIIAVIVLVFTGLIIFNNKSSGDDKKSTNDSSLTESATHSKGQGNAGVTLLEYGDYQCPACQAYSSIIDEVINHYGDDLKFEFRNYPLINLHPNSYAASRAAEAAGLQDKFWQMHDLLYNQGNWVSWTVAQNPKPLFEAYAKELGLDVDKFNEDYKSSQVNNTIQADKAAGDKLKITGTPTFYLNGELLENVGANANDFIQKIDIEIDKVKNQAD